MSNNNKAHIYILSGGIGSRFWPKSRKQYPKQFIDILGLGKSLLQLTAERFTKIFGNENIYFITHKDYKPLIRQQIADIPEANILCEPARRNTAPCIAYAAFKLCQQDPEGIMIIVPSDHLILKEEEYISKISEAIEFVKNNESLLTLGIKPTRPDTGYGYIHYTQSADADIYPVVSFTEKPDKDTAQKYVNSGEYLWNAGMFIWKAKDIVDAFRNYEPEIYNIFEKGNDVYNTEDEAAYIDAVYQNSPDISIDYAILEKAGNVYTLPVDIGWSDLGTWNSLHDIYESKDQDKNALIAKHIYITDSENCMVSAPKNKLMVIKGLKDYIVVDDDDVLLIYPKKEEQEIKSVLKTLNGKTELEHFL
ncbi:MAG: mannose-1-phosphate guanylyltransferase [Arachidicoccus sp.]|nr:mannose-1-phosphate guanylyltransferase [Arachidicoccus sp.]